MRRNMSLDGEWQVWHCQDGHGSLSALEGITWLKGSVPGCAQHDLVEQGRIDDPFFERNTRQLYDLEEHEWWYRTQFDVPAQFQADHVELVFHGLDTFATVWVNGVEVGHHSNMFIPVAFDVTDVIKPGQNNTVIVRLASAVQAVSDLPLEGAHASMNTHERLWARKLDQCYGWDIAPRIVTAGIWRGVELAAYHRARLGEDFFRVTDISPTPASPTADQGVRAHILHEIPVQTLSGDEDGLRVRVSGECGDSRFRVEGKVEAGTARLEFDVSDARLWWTWDLGEPNLYDLVLEIWDGDELVERRRRKQGLRTIRLVEEDQGEGNTSYVFELNGVPFFARGMNWTPASCYHALADGAKHDELLAMCRRMNLNMLRVWGGGVYEPAPWFRKLDQLGIMVYQDFMMSCAMYPLHPDFLDAMASEAQTVIKQLRNYACLALWCGDNENDVAYWGWYGQKTDVRDNKITRGVLPAAVEEFDGTRGYVPSSPYSPNPDVDPQDQHQGDTHCWHHGTPFEDAAYTQDESRFISEIGHLSCPAVETLKSFLSPHSLWPNENPVWDHHIGVHEDLEFSPPRRKAMDDSVIAYFGEKPTDLETYVLATQICQGEAYKLWTEHCRQRKQDWQCGGILLWNVADCWPQFSDAVIDYYLRPKLACNYVKWACSPIHVSFLSRSDGTLALHVANDTLGALDATYHVAKHLAPGQPEGCIEGRVHVPANGSMVVADLNDIAEPVESGHGYLSVQLRVQDRTVSYNRRRLRKPTLDEIPAIIASLPAF